MNKAIIIGNVGADPEVKTLPSGIKVANLSIATTKNFKKKDSEEWQSLTEWHKVAVWGNDVSKIEGKVKKGHLVSVEGSIHYKTYENKEGEKRYFTEIQSEKFTNLTKKPKEASASQNNQAFEDETDDLPF